MFHFVILNLDIHLNCPRSRVKDRVLLSCCGQVLLDLLVCTILLSLPVTLVSVECALKNKKKNIIRTQKKNPDRLTTVLKQQHALFVYSKLCSFKSCVQFSIELEYYKILQIASHLSHTILLILTSAFL